MNRTPTPSSPGGPRNPARPPRLEEPPTEPEIQQGGGRSIANDERLKRLLRQHPIRDEPKVDSVEPDEAPPI